MSEQSQPRLSVVGTGYLGAVHAACMANFDSKSSALTSTSSRSNNSVQGNRPSMSLASPRSSTRRWNPVVCTSPRIWPKPPRLVTSTSSALALRKAQTNAADISYVNAAVEGLVPHLTGDALLSASRPFPWGLRLDFAT